MNATAATAQISPADMLYALDAYADVVKRFTKEMNWQNAVSAYSIRKAAGQADAPFPKGLPSKAHKHQMYDAASRLAYILKLDGERPHTLPDVAALIATVTAILMDRN